MSRLLSHRASLSLIGCLLTLFLHGQSLSAPTARMHLQLSRILHLETAIELDDIPGLQLLLIDTDTAWLDRWGSLSTDTLVLPTDSTVYEVGALSMIATAALTCIGAAEGLALDSAVWTYLPDSFRLSALKSLTLRDLLTHRTGLPRQPDMKGMLDRPDEAPFAHYSWSDLLQWLRRTPLEASADFAFSYINYALLQLALEHHYGMPLDQLFQKKIAQPLRLRETGFEWTQAMRAQLAPPYNRSGQKVAPWQFASFQGALGLKTSPRDMYRLVRWIMHDPRCQPIRQPATRVPYRKDVWATAGAHATFPRKRLLVISQSGATDGHAAYIAMAPDYDKAVVVFANSAIGLGKFGYLALRFLTHGWKVDRKQLKKKK